MHMYFFFLIIILTSSSESENATIITINDHDDFKHQTLQPDMYLQAY